MKRIYSSIIMLATCFAALSFVACDKGTDKVSTEQTKIDSLTNVTKKQQSRITDMESFITSLSQTMDSIDMQERELVGEGDLEKREKKSKAMIINDLRRFKETLERQKQQIMNLESQLAAKEDEMSAKMLQIVTFYKKELEAKDKTIASLQQNIATNKRDIKNLQASVDHLILSNKEKDETIKEQENIMTNQTTMINICYVKIGTKSDLKKAGIITGGFLKKSKLDYSKMSPDLFTEMDMRKCNDIPINSSNPKILTQMPASSYEIVKTEKGSYLHITNPSLFWSISKYLVVQL